jgi:hypothetical protein
LEGAAEVKSGIDVIREVWCDTYDEPVVVRAYLENKDFIQISWQLAAAESVEIVVPAEMALKLSVALSECALEQMLARDHKEQQ